MPPDTCYAAFGLSIASAVPLPELPLVGAPAVPDVTIRRGRAETGESGGAALWGDRHRAVLTVPDVARYEVREGREIIFQTCDGAEERHVRLFLLGSALGVLLHQRQLLPLHANAIEVDGEVVAFSGHSGAGKSTLAAWFHDRGRRVLSDDVCVIGQLPGGKSVAYPGIPRLRLWRDALERSGRNSASFDPTWLNDASYDKFDVPIVPTDDVLAPRPLAAIYLLRQGDPPARINRLGGSEAMSALISNTYRGAFIPRVGDAVAHWKQCHSVAEQVPIFEVIRAFDKDRFEDDALLLEDHVESQLRQ